MKKIYKTKRYYEWGGCKWYEYYIENEMVYKYKHTEIKFFDGCERFLVKNDELVEAWDIFDRYMPEWLLEYI